MANIIVSSSRSRNSDISSAINEILEEYGNSVQSIVNQEVESAAKEGVKKLRSKFRAHGRKFYKSIDKKKIEKAGGVFVEFEIYEKAPQYRLAHLLEDGHRTVGANAKVKHTVSLGYFGEIEKWLIKEVPSKILQAINKLK